MAAIRSHIWFAPVNTQGVQGLLEIEMSTPSTEAGPQVEYANTRWSSHWCKRCLICVQICPTKALELKEDTTKETEGCIRCRMCERFCPDLAIEVRETAEKDS
ncbi:MAG: 4Fe-4S ferredoxin [Dehalococcoidia bacterium]|nr:4Fe-4S ferredoxin [Dehalococcoidia bacterium]